MKRLLVTILLCTLAAAKEKPPKPIWVGFRFPDGATITLTDADFAPDSMLTFTLHNNTNIRFDSITIRFIGYYSQHDLTVAGTFQCWVENFPAQSQTVKTCTTGDTGHMIVPESIEVHSDNKNFIYRFKPGEVRKLVTTLWKAKLVD